MARQGAEAKIGGKLATPAESTTELVARVIMEGIRTGSYVPGQHLLEPDLTRRIGISRGSLREALKHLSAAGIVTLNRFRGAYISALDKKAVLDLLETLEPLACLAARLAARNCVSPESRQLMREATEGIEAAERTGNLGLYLERRKAFYDAMILIGGNRELARVMPLSRTDLFRAQLERVQTEEQRHRYVGRYRKISDAIIRNQVLEAEREVKKHFREARAIMGQLPDYAFPAQLEQ